MLTWVLEKVTVQSSEITYNHYPLMHGIYNRYHKTVGLTLLHMSNTLQKVVGITVCDFTPSARKSLSCISWELRIHTDPHNVK
jgi:hypothetical protein